MYNPQKTPLVEYLTERGLPESQADARTIRDEERQEALRTRGETIKQWRDWIPTATPAGDLTNLRAVREMTGFSVGDVADIVGQSPNTVEAAEFGKQTIADDALRAFVGGAISALAKGGE